jgi:hypothetical protein
MELRYILYNHSAKYGEKSNIVYNFLISRTESYFLNMIISRETKSIELEIAGFIRAGIIKYDDCYENYLMFDIERELIENQYSETLLVLADRLYNKDKITIKKGKIYIYKSDPEDEGDEGILLEHTEFIIINGILKKQKDEQGEYYFK